MSKSEIKSAFTVASIELADIMRERTGQDIDVNGKPLPSLKKSYRIFKKRYIDKKTKYRTRKKRVKRSTSVRYRDLQTTTRFRAKALPNHGRLTGKTFSSWKPVTPRVRRTNRGFSIIWGVRIVGKRNQRVNEYLVAMKRAIFGLATKNPRRQKELSRIYDKVFKSLGFTQAQLSQTKSI